METVLLQINNDRAYKLLEELEAMHIVKVLEKNTAPKKKAFRKICRITQSLRRGI